MNQINPTFKQNDITIQIKMISINKKKQNNNSKVL